MAVLARVIATRRSCLVFMVAPSWYQLGRHAAVRPAVLFLYLELRLLEGDLADTLQMFWGAESDDRQLPASGSSSVGSDVEMIGGKSPR